MFNLSSRWDSRGARMVPVPVHSAITERFQGLTAPGSPRTETGLTLDPSTMDPTGQATGVHTVGVLTLLATTLEQIGIAYDLQKCVIVRL